MTSNRKTGKTIEYLIESGAQTYALSRFFLEKNTDIWKNRESFGLKGGGYDWHTEELSFNDLDHIIKDMFLKISEKSPTYHWPAACIEIHNHINAGKTMKDFLFYLDCVHKICLEDLLKKPDQDYTEDYKNAFSALSSYFN